jgi:ABC-type Fe3+/spermidine/putrescine transport system ATPase subunit
LIELKKIRLGFGSFHLKDINLHVRTGEYFVILGPTGSGKSSVLNCIAGHYAVDSGEVWVDGRLSTRLAVEERDVGYVFQAGLLFPHLNVRKNIAFGLTMRKNADSINLDARIRDICNLFSIAHLLDRSVHNLSGGEKQRVALARSMICNPKAMLLDEPFSSVDRNTAEKLMIEFKRIQRDTGQTVVHVTHNQEEAMILADRICVMKDGAIVQIGSPQDILTRPETEFVADFFGTHNIFRGTATADGEGCRIELKNKTITAGVRRNGTVVFSIRPEDAVIAGNGNTCAGPNTFAGKVRQVVDRGIIVQVEVDVGFPLVSYNLRKSIAEMKIDVGTPVNVCFDADAVHIIEQRPEAE